MPAPQTPPTASMASSQAITYPHRTAASTYRVPTPPRIVVPPPTLNTESLLPQITLSTLPHTAFLSTAANYTDLIPRNALTEWTYEQRREAQKILPYLYLGPMTAAKDEEFLRREGVTCVVAVRQKAPAGTNGGGVLGRAKLMGGALAKAAALGLQIRTVDLSDNQELISSFPATTALIYDHVREHYQTTGQLGKVLVFCESGNERSAGVVAAYLMETHADVDFIKAMQLCQAQRFCANFDDAMKRLLQGYWDILCARRAVAAAAGEKEATTVGNGTVKGKRTLQPDEDEDEEMDVDSLDHPQRDDQERFGGRTFAPFVDTELLPS